MSRLENRYGVHISEVSDYWKSFSRHSMIPSGDLTRELLDEARRRSPADAFSAATPKDVTVAGCWIGHKMRNLKHENGRRVFTERNIAGTQFNLGRGAFEQRNVMGGKTLWETAVLVWLAIKKEPKGIMDANEETEYDRQRLACED